MPAAEVIVRSLAHQGVDKVFCNLGTDHPPLIEATAKLRADDGAPDPPEFITCLHESVALSAAHGYAVSTGRPQAVFVHVDVGTQNLGAMLHDAHRGDAPVFIFAGLAPNTQYGHSASRANEVHFLQDVYDQEGIVREYTRWSGEYRLPGDPDELVVRGLELAASPRKGPVYLTATGEALETEVETDVGARDATPVRPSPADVAQVERVASMVDEAESPLVIASKLGLFEPDESVASLVEFAETAGAGVVESRPAGLNFPRDHELHVGFTPQGHLEEADLVVLANVDIPWVPSPEQSPPDDVPVIQIDVDPLKPAYPQFDLDIDLPVAADPVPTLRAIADHLDTEQGESGRRQWRETHRRRIEGLEDTARSHHEAGRLSPAHVSARLEEHLAPEAVVLNETTTNHDTVLDHLRRTEPGTYFNPHGSGLGWAPGAGVGVKLAKPDRDVVALVGDGSYVFGQPTATAWTASAFEAPTLTVVYNNGMWNAVRGATRGRHPDGMAAARDVPESRFDPVLDLSKATEAVESYSRVVEDIDALDDAIEEGLAATRDGLPGVVDVRVDQP